MSSATTAAIFDRRRRRGSAAYWCARDHITPALRQLHWLPIKARITYKICLLMFNINSGSSPRYMSSLVTPCNQLQSRTNLRSSTKGDDVIQRTTRTVGRRAFSVAGPSEWIEQSTNCRPSSAIYLIFQIQTQKLTCSKFITAEIRLVTELTM